MDGLGIIENFVTPEEEQDICKEIEKDEFLPRLVPLFSLSLLSSVLAPSYLPVVFEYSV